MCIQIYFVTFYINIFREAETEQLTKEGEKMTHKTGSGYRYPAEKLDVGGEL